MWYDLGTRCIWDTGRDNHERFAVARMYADSGNFGSSMTPPRVAAAAQSAANDMGR